MSLEEYPVVLLMASEHLNQSQSNTKGFKFEEYRVYVIKWKTFLQIYQTWTIIPLRLTP